MLFGGMPPPFRSPTRSLEPSRIARSERHTRPIIKTLVCQAHQPVHVGTGFNEVDPKRISQCSGKRHQFGSQLPLTLEIWAEFPLTDWFFVQIRHP